MAMASVPYSLFVNMSISLVLTMLPNTAPRFPIMAAVMRSPFPLPLKPITKVVMMAPMPKAVPILVRAGT